MLRLLSATLVVLALLVAVPTPAQAQIQAKAYAPENLRTLSRQDQERVISQEYSEQSRGRRIPDDQLRFYIDQVNRSNWGFSRIKQDIATSLSGSNGGWNPNPGNGASVLCESTDNRRRECRTGFRGRAALSENLSKVRCVENQNWGSGNGTLWVDRGCRGRFVESSFGSGGTVRCESIDGRRRECATNFRGRAVVSRQLSNTRCTENQNWGQQRAGTIWVSGGCRAEFTQGSGNWNPGDDYSVTCSSVDKRRATCAWTHRNRAVLLQQLSSESCREGYSWGQTGNQIWVDRGCRARFGVR